MSQQGQIKDKSQCLDSSSDYSWINECGRIIVVILILSLFTYTLHKNLFTSAEIRILGILTGVVVTIYFITISIEKIAKFKAIKDTESDRIKLCCLKQEKILKKIIKEYDEVKHEITPSLRSSCLEDAIEEAKKQLSK